MEQQTPAVPLGTRGFEIAFSSSGEGRSPDNALAEGGSIRILEKVLSMCGNVLLCVSLKPIICQGSLLNWKKKSPSKHKHS